MVIILRVLWGLLSLLGFWTAEGFFPGEAQAQVEQAWVRRYNGPGNSSDTAHAIGVDGAGNVYVTGTSYNGSGTGYDYTTIKYDASGNKKWVKRYNGPGNDRDTAYAIAVDGAGNVYVTGRSDGGAGTGDDYATIKYDTNGNRKWVRRYNGPGNSVDGATAIAVDGAGNVYVTGYSGGSGTENDYATVKYDADGNRKWVRRYNSPLNYKDEAWAIAVDGAGNVYVNGSSISPIGLDDDYATIKYDADGNRKWVRRFNGPAISSNYTFALAVDGPGNVYVTGLTYGGSDTGYNYTTVKYDTNGNQKWVKHYNGPANSDDGAGAIAVDGAGNVYVTGGSTGNGTGMDYATVKYDPNGNQKWVRRYNGPADAYDAASAMAVDGAGNVYVTGGSTGNGTGEDYTTIKYDTNGNQKWVKRYSGPGNGTDSAGAIAVDGQGNVYVTGHSDGVPGTGDDYATIKYTQ